MAGKTIEQPTAPISIEALRAAILAEYSGVPFEHPNPLYGTQRVAKLKSGEREHIVTAARLGDASFNSSLWNRLTVAYGLVAPEILPRPADDKMRTTQEREAYALAVADALKEFPDDYIGPIAEKVWELTNTAAAQKAADGPAPFSKGSGVSTGSGIDSTSSPAK